MKNTSDTVTKLGAELTVHAMACSAAGGKLIGVPFPRFPINDKRCPMEGDLSPVMNGPDAHTLSPGCGRMHYRYGFATLPLVPCGGTMINIDKTETRMFCPKCEADMRNWSI